MSNEAPKGLSFPTKAIGEKIVPENGHAPENTRPSSGEAELLHGTKITKRAIGRLRGSKRLEMEPREFKRSSCEKGGHHWLIESPKGETSEGCCKGCGAKRTFRNWVDESESFTENQGQF